MHTSSTSPKGITTYNMEKERKIRRATQVNLKKHDYQCGHGLCSFRRNSTGPDWNRNKLAGHLEQRFPKPNEVELVLGLELIVLDTGRARKILA